MSIEIMTQVWKDSNITEARDLLALLALADWSNDWGGSWWSQPKLAQRVRIQERALRDLIARLNDSGEIAVYDRPGRTSLIVVLTGVSEFERAARLREAEVWLKRNDGSADQRRPSTPAVDCPSTPAVDCPSTPAVDCPPPRQQLLPPTPAVGVLKSADDPSYPTMIPQGAAAPPVKGGALAAPNPVRGIPAGGSKLVYRDGQYFRVWWDGREELMRGAQ